MMNHMRYMQVNASTTDVRIKLWYESKQQQIKGLSAIVVRLVYGIWTRTRCWLKLTLDLAPWVL